MEILTPVETLRVKLSFLRSKHSLVGGEVSRLLSKGASENDFSVCRLRIISKDIQKQICALEKRIYPDVIA